MENTTIDEWRAAVYTGLALAFGRPDQELAKALESGQLAEVFRSASDTLGVPGLAEAADRTEEAIRDEPNLAAIYGRTFGVEADAGIALYEVAYVPGSIVTNTDVLADIAGFYRAFGLQTVDGSRDRVDALSTQLEFVGYLADRRALYLASKDRDAVDIVTDATATFLEDHLGRWVPRLVLDILDEVSAPMYRGFADALGAVVEADLERFEVDPAIYAETPTAPLEAIAGHDASLGRTEIGCGASAVPTATSPRRQP